jgi:sterol desaturase/sphingolipid hydroxylase (fatty acid hydroxylase superfamily)
VPIGAAFPGYARVLTGPFNIAGALCLVFGAAFSAYVYMPKRKVLAASAVRVPVLAQAWYFVGVCVNLVASLPGAVAALFAGKLNSRVPATLLIALGGFIPGLTSGLNRFGVTWSFFLGEFLGVLLIFAGFLVSEDVFHNLRVFSALRSGRQGEKIEVSG